MKLRTFSPREPAEPRIRSNCIVYCLTTDKRKCRMNEPRSEDIIQEARV